jgi:hypothetical protein
MPDDTPTIKPHPLKGRPSPVKGRLYLDRHAERLVAEGSGNGAEPDDLLTTKQLTAWLPVSKSWLEGRRSQGKDGPPFLRLGPGRIVYPRGGVVAWLKTRQYRSTAEYRNRETNAAPVGAAPDKPIVLGPTKSGLCRLAPLPAAPSPSSAEGATANESWSAN